MSLLRFLFRRLVMLVASLLVASVVIFASVHVAPGNPIAALSGGRTIPPESQRILEERYGLNDPLPVQYWSWLTNALHGDLGISITMREDVSKLIVARIPTTAGLVLYASVLVLVFGVGMGVIAGLGRGFVDTATVVVSAITAAIPAFVAAIALILVFAVRLGWFPAVGNGTSFLDTVWHLTLPAVALALSAIAIVTRVTRAAIREEAGREHVQTAVSRGIPRWQMIRRHVLRNAAIPITTVIGITIASLIAVAAVVEMAFGLNGLGSYLVKSAQSKDIAVVQGISLMLVTAFVAVNTLIDLLYAMLDPRVSLGSRAE
ncbi:MAG: ABC transporter permease [Thermoleophilia bacterium]